MRFYKLRVVPNATKIASAFNEQITGEENIDLEREPRPRDKVLIGESVRVFQMMTRTRN